MERHMTVCPYCGTGCKFDLLVEGEKIVGVEPLNGVTNEGALCLKGLYGFDFVNDTKILTPRLRYPMYRRSRDRDFERISWDEAIAIASSRLSAVKEKYGPDAIMTTGSSRGTGNETNYVMQKFARAVIGTNNVDNCARVCHGPSVAGLATTLGNGAMSNSIPEIEHTDCILVFGYNVADSHPVIARRIIKAKERGAKIIVCDPRRIETARLADLHLPLRNGSNMALVNAFANVLLEEELYDKAFVANHAEGFDAYREIVAKYTPEYVEPITGLEAAEIREAMRIYAAAPSATILWGMGVTQWTQGVEVVKALSALAILTGNLGKPHCGVGPVRGQNNVQGSCDMGALPNVYPGYQEVSDPAVREKFAKAWGVESLPTNPGARVTEVPHLVEEGKLKAFYLMGEDPAQTDPDLASVRRGLEGMEFVIVQDIFMTKTAMFADLILPASSWGEHGGVFSAADRSFQRFEAAVPVKGECKHDWAIISEIATAMGYPMKYENTREIWDELRSLCPLFYGATYEKMEGLGYVRWPCTDLESEHGTEYLYTGNVFQRPGGKALLVTSDWRPPLDQLSEEFPLVLCTVREVGHYSCRSMTGNCSALQTLADEPGFVTMNPKDAEKLGIKDQQLVWVSSKRGKVITRAKVTERTNEGAVYMTYQWWIGACNELTIEGFDPTSKTPEYKYSAVKVEPIEDQAWAETYVQEEYAKLKNGLSSAVESGSRARVSAAA